jgi:protein-tyrosine phosphatase
VIDTHAHILAGLDDGPPDLDASVAIARAAVAEGTRVLAATSHIDHHFELEPEQLRPAREAVQARLAEEGIPLEVVQGGEIAISRLIDLSDEALAQLTLGDGGALLVECPFTLAVGDLEPMIADLEHRGFRTVLGHPERCPAFQREPGRAERLAYAGALLQVTAGSIRGEFGTGVQQFAMALVRRGHAHILASDAHDTEIRPPGMRSALELIEHEAPGLGTWLSSDVPAAVLSGAPIPRRPHVVLAPPPPRPTKGLARLFKRA